MQIISVADSYRKFKKIRKYSDGIIIRYDKLNYKSNNELSLKKIVKLIKKISDYEREVFLDCSIIAANRNLETFRNLLEKIDLNLIKGLIVTDLGFLNIALEKNIAKKIIYNPETMITNREDFNFLKEFDVFGVFIANELNVLEVKEILENKTLKSFLTGFGYISMFYSKRKILKNFIKENNICKKTSNNLKYSLKEEFRNEKYPVLESAHGSAIFRPKAFSIFPYIEELKENDYLLLENSFLKFSTYKQIVVCFNDYLTKKISAAKAERIVSSLLNVDTGLLNEKSVLEKRQIS